MLCIGLFASACAKALPETHALLMGAKLTVHPAVVRVVLHGSRGLAGGYRPDSDIDLSLLVDIRDVADEALEPLLRAVFTTTFEHWQSPIEPDLAIVFDRQGCGLRCFARTAWDETLCPGRGVDCFGLYKVQKGFTGIVDGAGVQVRLMYPCLTVWERE